jgi:hypothetical protein
MRMFRDVSSLAALALTAVALPALAQDCPSRQLPDGTWTSECPSQIPPVPPEGEMPQVPPESLYTITCVTPQVTCTFRHSMYMQGAQCHCIISEPPGYALGVTW